MAEQKVVRSRDGIVVSTAICAGGVDAQHSEGVVVSTALAAGGSIGANHAEGIALTTSIVGGGLPRPTTRRAS